MEKIKITIIVTCLFMQVVWPSAAAWSGQRTPHVDGVLYADGDITSHEPGIVVIEEGAVPRSTEKTGDGWFSRNKWYVVGGLVVVAGAAGAAAGSGGGGGGSKNDRAEVEVTW